MTEMQVAVFDLDEAGRREVSGAVRDYFAHARERASVQAYGDIPSLAYGFRAAPFDMLFAVVRNMMGVEAARAIREADGALPIFLVSDSGEYALEGYRLHALHYLLHPITADKVGEAVARQRFICLRGLTEFEGAEKKEELS